MSRIGRMPIPLPKGVEVQINNSNVAVKGPKGTLSRVLPEGISIKNEDGVLYVERSSDEKVYRSLHGLSRTLVANMVTGVSEGFTKILHLHGIGYRAQIQGDRLVLGLGFSHDTFVIPPKSINITTDNSSPNVDNTYRTAIITITGIDKELVGQVAAKIRALKKPEPYKGKGLRYLGERVIRKAGKAGKAGKK